MSKQVKRVALDFDYPLEEVWTGYINPYRPRDCEACDMSGLNPESRHLYHTFGQWEHKLTQDEIDVLIEKNRLKEGSTAEEINRSRYFHDSINTGYLLETRAKRLGVWGPCEHCKGDGFVFDSEEERELSDEWEETEPPTGEGWQLWHDERPQSPVFRTAEELAAWCAPNAPTFGTTNWASKGEWLKMIEENHIYHQHGNMIFC